MFGDDECIVEVGKKFKYTVLGITDSGKTHYAKYTGYSSTNERHILEDRNGYKIQLGNNTQTQVFIPDPKRGVYNTPDGAVLFFRQPFRQHKRGLYSETAFILPFKQVFYQRINFFDHNIFDVLENQNQKPLTFLEAADICNNVASAAIDRHFSMSLSHIDEKNYSLFYEFSYIGQVNVETKEIFIHVPTFKQELFDMLSERGIHNYRVRTLND